MAVNMTSMSGSMVPVVQTELRCVFDIGSGGTKGKLFLVDTVNNHVLETVNEVSYPVPYQKWVSNSYNKHYLPLKAMITGINTIDKILKEFDINPYMVKCGGIATAWARGADNSYDYIEFLKHDMNVHVKEVSQDEEGKIGFQAAQYFIEDNNITIEDIVFWDIGGGSFQLGVNSNDDIYVYSGEYGASNFAYDIREIVGANATGILSREQVEEAIIWSKKNIVEQICYDDILGNYTYGNASFFAMGQVMNKDIKPLVNSNYIHKEQVKQAIYDFADSSSFEQLHDKYAGAEEAFIDGTHTNLILIYSVMDKMNIDYLNFIDAKSVDAVALDNDIWNDDNFVLKSLDMAMMEG